MARTLTFALGGADFAVEPMKIDRKKLYGWTEVHAFDDEGNECQLVSTDSSGTIIIPKGGIGLGIESTDGKWVERSELRTVNEDGSDAELVPSSYSAVIELTRKASDEEFLDCSVTGFYHLAGAEPGLVEAVGEDIYAFDYCYRDAYETSPAFVLAADVEGEKELFMFVGVKNDFSFIGLNEVSTPDEGQTDEEEESDDIDFSMF